MHTYDEGISTMADIDRELERIGVYFHLFKNSTKGYYEIPRHQIVITDRELEEHYRRKNIWKRLKIKRVLKEEMLNG